METLNIVSILSELNFDKIVWIWHVIHKFSNEFQIKYYISCEKDPSPHQLNSLIYKIDHLNKIGNNVDLKFFFKNQLTNNPWISVSDIRQKCKLELNHEFILYIGENCLFTQQSIEEIIYLIQCGFEFGIDNEFYFQALGMKIPLGGPYHTGNGDLEWMRLNNPKIWIFKKKDNGGSFYNSWFSSYKKKYLEEISPFKKELCQ